MTNHTQPEDLEPGKVYVSELTGEEYIYKSKEINQPRKFLVQGMFYSVITSPVITALKLTPKPLWEDIPFKDVWGYVESGKKVWGWNDGQIPFEVILRGFDLDGKFPYAVGIVKGEISSGIKADTKHCSLHHPITGEQA